MRNLWLTVVALLVAANTYGGESAADKIIRAKSAAHSMISENATVMDVDGTILQKGSNGWVCMPGIGPGDDHPMCNDQVWVRLMQAAASGSDFQTDRIGISYMLQGDANVSNSDPAAKDPNNGDVWVQEGPHLMVVVPKPMLAGLSDDPYNGGPYVMWKDTPYAHIMVPVRVGQ
jgi:hypothetical protein